MRISTVPQDRPSLRVLFALAFSLLCTVIAPSHADDAVPDTRALVDALRAQALPLALEAGTLRGPGAEWIARESAGTQFVLIGEDHGMAEPPQLAAALWRAHMGGRFGHLVIETGPRAAAALEDAARRADDGMSALAARFPTAIPFFDWQDDGAMASAAVRDGDKRRALWGVDQEFVLSGRLLFRELAALAPNDAARTLANDYAARDDALYRRMVAQRDTAAALLTQVTTDDFATLRRAFARSRDALALIADLEASATIYRADRDGDPSANTQRAALMKRNFMRAYRSAQRNGAMSPRALFRLGAFHAGRGLSPLGVFDLGNFVSELAQSNGMTSLHVLVLAAGGEANRWFPFAPDEAARRAPYDAAGELGSIGAQPFLDAADRTQWSLIPLASLRTRPELRRAGGAKFERLIYGYDAVIVVPAAHAATGYGLGVSQAPMRPAEARGTSVTAAGR